MKKQNKLKQLLKLNLIFVSYSCFVTKISELKSGIHAIYIHEKSDCTAMGGSSVGGHWNPTLLITNEWCIGCGDTTKDMLGKRLIVHTRA